MVVAPDGYIFQGFLSSDAISHVFKVAAGDVQFACKRLSSRAHRSTACADLKEEGHILRALDGRSAPRLHALGEDACGPFLVMSLVEGGSLSEGLLLPYKILFEALANVHEARDAEGRLEVVHADISPSNVMVTADGGSCTFVDFGLAQWRGRKVFSGTVRGTLQYAAPEIARSEEFDVRADLFALAASALHVRSGISPRQAQESAPLIRAAAEQSLQSWAASASTGLPMRDVLMACLEFDRNDRPRSAREVALQM